MNKNNYDNYTILTLLEEYINSDHNSIKEDEIKKVMMAGVSEEYAYSSLLASYIGLDDEYIDRYLKHMLRKERTSNYTNNPFYQKMNLEKAKVGSLELTYKYIEPYELFMQDELDEYLDGRLFVQVGYFDDDLKCLCIKDGEDIIHKFSPFLVNASSLAIEEVKGKVGVLGLGIGYFSYMAHLKDNVKSVTIYEQNQELIDLFNKYILPKFDHKEKIKVIKMAPISYLKAKDDKNKYDYIFNNAWDDLENGIKLYPQFKKLEKNHPNSKYLYFLENSINSYPKGE